VLQKPHLTKHQWKWSKNKHNNRVF